MFSIIIPVHNSELYLEECLNSVLKQISVEIEVILVIDHSIDNSYSICFNAKEKDDRVFIYRSEKKGVSCARNYGIEKAKGDYLLFVDSDDILYSDACFSFSNFITNYELVVSAYEIFSKKHVKQQCVSSSENIYLNIKSALDKALIQSVWAKCFRRDIIVHNNIRFKEEMNYGEDTLFLYEYLSYVKTIIIIENITYRYRINKNGISRKYIPDKLKVDAALCRKLIDVCGSKISNKDIIYIKNWWICNSFRTYMLSISRNCSFGEFRSKITDVYADRYIISTINQYKFKSKYWNLIKSMVLNNNHPYVLLLLLKLYNLIK